MIRLLHLYHNLMNLYGEYGNISVLKQHLQDQGLETDVVQTDTLEQTDLEQFDFIYIGSGTEKNQKQALKDLRQHKTQLQAFAEKGKPMLLTGNAFELFGNTITDCGGTVYEGLGFDAFETIEQNTKRLTADVIAHCPFLSDPIVGFINKASKTTGVQTHFSNVKMGYGNDNENPAEGWRRQKLIGTHIIGPILVKNPQLLDYMVQTIAETKVPDFKFEIKDYPYAKSAYEITYQKLAERLN